MHILVNKSELHLMLKRLALHLTESVASFEDIVFVAIQPRGKAFGDALMQYIQQATSEKIQYGVLDITFYRDDIRKELHMPNQTDILFSIENKTVVVIDDVLYTGRTTRAALDALQDFGRPKAVQLCVLIDRKFSRELPIQPDFVGKAIDTITSQKVKVDWDKKEVQLF